MANGTSGDHPISDLIMHGKHPFPPDIEDLVRRLHGLNPSIFNELAHAPFDWEAGRHLQAASTLMHGLIETHGDPIARRRLVAEYRNATKK